MNNKTRKIIIIILSIIFLIASGFLVYQYKNNLSNKNDNISKKPEENNKEENDPYALYRKTTNFKLENANRYIAYKEKNPSLDYETIVTYVNIGLDYKFYSYTKDADTSKEILLLMNKYLKLSNDYEPLLTCTGFALVLKTQQLVFSKVLSTNQTKKRL